MKTEWFKLGVLILAIVLTYAVCTFLFNISYAYAYAERGKCLESIYVRGNSDGFDSKANCFDIIAKFAN